MLREISSALFVTAMIAGPFRGAQAEPIYLEENGIAVVEVESVSPVGKWVLHTNTAKYDFVNGFLGTGCFQYTGNTETSGSVHSEDVLTYKVKISTPGSYVLRGRGMEAPIEGNQGDQANDCFVLVEGHGQTATCADKFTKFVLLGNSYQWSWNVNLECGTHVFSFPTFNLQAGIYAVKFAGRSKNFFLDRFTLTKEGSGGGTDNTTTPSKIIDSAGTIITPPPPDSAVKILQPAQGDRLAMGSTITLKGEGANLQWAYDANSDGLGEIAIGAGNEVSFSVPTGVTGSKELTLICRGDGGSAQTTYSLTDAATALQRRIDTRPATLETYPVFSLTGGLVGYDAHYRNARPGVVVVRTNTGAVKRMLRSHTTPGGDR